MQESLTEGNVATAASQEPTDNGLQTTTAESTNQETISDGDASSQEAVSQVGANDENKQSADTDESLIKFAKAQGIDNFNELSDLNKRLLKSARDSQSALRSKQAPSTMVDAINGVSNGKATDQDLEQIHREIAQYNSAKRVDEFWSVDGRDKGLEPEMVKILQDKKAEYGEEYARNLSADLATLYGLAQLSTGKIGGNMDEDKIRQEERDSINKQLASGSTQSHAISQNTETDTITTEWLMNGYDPSNPEHRDAVDKAMANGTIV